MATAKLPTNIASAAFTASAAKSWVASPPIVPSSWRMISAKSATPRPSRSAHSRRLLPMAPLGAGWGDASARAEALLRASREFGHDVRAFGIGQRDPACDFFERAAASDAQAGRRVDDADFAAGRRDRHDGRVLRGPRT